MQKRMREVPVTRCFCKSAVAPVVALFLWGTVPAPAAAQLSPLTVGTPSVSTRSVRELDDQQPEKPVRFDREAPESTPARPGLARPFVDALKDFKALPSWQNVEWLVAGLGATAAIRPADKSITAEWSEARTRAFKPGAIVGLTPVQLGGAFATYALGLTTHSPRTVKLGSDLIRAQLVASGLTFGLKGAIRRDRPDGGGYSFPSGHASVTFASATVLQQHFGWKAGIPAYAVASYVAASRVQMKRHYLTDVAFGATIGIVAARTVTIGDRHKLLMSPMASTEGAGLSFTWLGKH